MHRNKIELTKTPEAIDLETLPTSLVTSSAEDPMLEAVKARYPESKRNRDAIITNDGFVLKIPTKSLTMEPDQSSGLISYASINVSQIAAYREALMLSLGRCFLGDIFPEPTFEKIDKNVFLKIVFIEGASLGIQYFDKNPSQFIADLAKLTTIMVLFKNSDMYADNLIVSPDASIHGIDLVECGRQSLKDFGYVQWHFRSFETNDTFKYVNFPRDLLRKLEEHEDLYCTEVHKAINLIRSKIEKEEDKACIQDFHASMKSYMPLIDHEEKRKFMDMAWYEKSREDFIVLTKNFHINKYQLLYSEMYLTLGRLLKETTTEVRYNPEEYQHIRLSDTSIFDIRRFNPFGIDRIKFKDKRKDHADGIVLYGKKAKFRINENKLLPEQWKLLSNLRAYLKNHPLIQKEVLFPEEAKKPPKQESYWDKNWRFLGFNENFYENIHGILCDEIEVAAIKLYRSGKINLKILDIPCGQNPLIETLLKRNNLFSIGFSSLTFIMVDRSQPSIDLCKSKKLILPTGVSTDYVMSAAESFESPNCDIIISCGGLLHSRVAKDRDQAKSQLKKYLADLNSGGYLITSGLSFNLVSASTMRKTGFEVIVGNCKGMPSDKNVYVAQKPSSEKSSLLEEKKLDFRPPSPLQSITESTPSGSISDNLFSIFYHNDSMSRSTFTHEHVSNPSTTTVLSFSASYSSESTVT